MAYLKKLKQEINVLKSIFPKDHDRFQVYTASIDEVICKFISPTGQHFEIVGNITETYPGTPPFWFSDTDDYKVCKAIEKLSQNSGQNNHILNQIEILITELSRTFCLSEPSELQKLIEKASSLEASTSTLCSSKRTIDEIDDDDDDYEEDDSEDEEVEEFDLLEMEESLPESTKKQVDDMDIQYSETLKKLQQKNCRDFLKDVATGSVLAINRLMKELKEIFRSDCFKKGIYSVELIHDNIFEWDIKFMIIDSDSDFYRDLQKLKKKEGEEFLQFNFKFDKTYPFEPPIVRLVYPNFVYGFHIIHNGRICMKLLTVDGWSSAYTVEGVIMQITNAVINEKTRIMFDKSKKKLKTSDTTSSDTLKL